MSQPLRNLPLASPPVPHLPPSVPSVAPLGSGSAPVATLQGMPQDLILHIISFFGKRPDVLNREALIALTRTCRSMRDVIQPQLPSLIAPHQIRHLQDDLQRETTLLNKLIIHIRLGDIDDVRSLLAGLQDPAKTPAEQVSVATVPLHLLCMFKEYCTAGCQLLAHRCWPRQYSIYTLTIVDIAAIYGTGEILKLFLDAYPQFVERRDESEETLLFSAARFGHSSAIKELLNYGADTLVRNIFGSSPLTQIMSTPYTDEIVEARERYLGTLIAYGSSRKREIFDMGYALNIPSVLLGIIFQYETFDVNEEQDLFCCTPLSSAVRNCLLAIEDYLAGRRLLNARSTQQLHSYDKECLSKDTRRYSLQKKHVQYLLQAGASPDSVLDRYSGLSILDAAKHKRKEVVEREKEAILTLPPAPPGLGSLADLDALIASLEKYSKCKEKDKE